MLRKALIFVLSIAPVSTVFAGAIDFKLGSHVAEVTFMKQDATFGYGGADMGLGLLFNDEDDLMVSGAILVSGSSDGEVRGLHFGVGAKVYAGIVDLPSPLENQNGAGLAIGAQVRYVFPGKTPIAILLEGYRAPNVTSVSDFKGITEIRLALELEVTPSARAYIGYRTLSVDLAPNWVKDDEYKLDDRGHVGVRFAF